MKHLVDALNAHPKYIGALGTVTGWFTVERLHHAVQQALPVAQLLAVLLAAFVSLCSGILIAPKAWAQLRNWWRAAFCRS